MPSCITDAIPGYGENIKPSKIMYGGTTTARSRMCYSIIPLGSSVCSVLLHSSTEVAKRKLPVTSV